MKNILFATSKKTDGNMQSQSKNFQQNFKTFVESKNISSKFYLYMNQIHSSNVVFKDNIKKSETILNCDCIVTKSNITLAIRTADCLPLIFYDPENGLIAAAHAGYKGILQGIVENTVSELIKHGAEIKCIHLIIGPSIGVCCYNVEDNRLEVFKEKFGDLHGAWERRSSKNYLSLQKIVKSEALRLGLNDKNITTQDICTKCSNLYYSFRADHKIYGTENVSGLNITLAKLQ